MRRRVQPLVAGLATTSSRAALATLVTVLTLCACAPGVQSESTSSSTSSSTPTTTVPTVSTVSTDPLTVVALGDSVTAGGACDCEAFVDLLAVNAQAALGRDVSSINDGENGLTAADLDAQLGSDDSIVADVAKADFVVVAIGANDVTPLRDRYDGGGCPASCIGPVVAQAVAHTRSLLTRVEGIAPHARIAVTSYWNDFPDGQAEPDPKARAWTDQVTRALNTGLQQASRAAGSAYVDLYAPFKGDGSVDPTPLLAADGDHPNPQGHAVIAAALTTWILGGAGGLQGSETLRH
jgi:lysophospholipase L1-like esterase